MLAEDCICTEPGYCERYTRDMSGRLYELCRNDCPADRPCIAPERREALLLHLLGQPANEREIDPQKPKEEWPPGPGTELWFLIKELGIEAVESCFCKFMAGLMNHHGIAWCKEHITDIAKQLRVGAQGLNWTPKIKAMIKAGLTLGVRFKISVTGPYASLVKEAIRRAEEKENESAVHVDSEK